MPQALPVSAFASFRYPSYRSIWLSTCLNSSANWIQQLTLGWFAFELTKSPLITGAVLGVRMVPFIFVTPFSGALADKMDRRHLVAIGTATEIVAMVWLGLMVTMDQVQVWHLFLFALLAGAGSAILDPPRHVIIVESVPPPLITNAVALSMIGMNANRALGPALGGYIITFFGTDVSFYLQAVLYTLSILVVLSIAASPQQGPQAAKPSVLSNLRAGFRHVLAHPTTRGLILASFFPFFFLWAYLSGLLPVFNKEVLHGGAASLGLLTSMIGVGGVLGALAVAAVRRLGDSGRVLFPTGALAGMGMLAVSLTTWLPIAMVLMICLGAFQMAYLSMNNALLQATTPSQYRGRVMSISLFMFGLATSGSFAAGALAEVMGPDWTIFAGGAALAAALVTIFLLFPALRRVTAG